MADTKDKASPVKMKGEVTTAPAVKRNDDNEVTSMSFDLKAMFKGTVTVKARGDVASAYWSLTPGMKVSVTATKGADGTYVAEAIDLVSN